MAAPKKILFQIQIEGSEVAIRNATDLKLAISEIEKALKTTSDDTIYTALEQQALQLKAELRDVNAENQRTIRQFQAEKTGDGSYERLNQELAEARRQFKQLSAEERQGNIGAELTQNIQRLDAELKDIDASLGQFQRNVGNYPKELSLSFSQLSGQLGGVVPGFSQLNDAALLVRQGIDGIGASATATGKLLTGAFIGFQVVSLILDGVKALKEFSAETNNLRGEIQRTGQIAGEELANTTADVQAIAATFDAETKEVFESANALAKAFGISFEQATGLIENGFLSGANASGELLDVLKEYPRLFDQMGFSAEQFLEIQAKAAQEGVFSDKGVDAVKEFGIRIREQTVATRTSLESAFGREFTSELFAGINDGSITVAQALTRVSTKMRDTELPAKNLQEVISDVFGGPGEDAGDAFLKSLADVGQGIESNIKATDELTKRQSEQLAAEKELALAKGRVALQIAQVTGGTATLGQNVQRFGIELFGRFLTAIGPIITGFKSLYSGVVVFLQSLGLLSKEGGTATGVLNNIGTALSAVGRIIGFVVEAIGFLLGGIGRIIQDVPALNAIFSGLGNSLRFVLDVIARFPQYFAGATEAGRQFVTNIGGFFQKLLIDAQILFAQLQKLNPFNETDTQLDAQIASLEAKKADIEKGGRSLAEAFRAGFDSVKKPELSVTVPGQAAPTDSKTTSTAPGGSAPRAGGNLTTEAAKKAAAESAKLQKEALDAQKKFADERTALLVELGKRLADVTIQNIQDETARELAAEQQRFDAVSTEWKKQDADFLKSRDEARSKVVAAYGATSQQVKDFDTQAAAAFQAQQEQQFQVLEAGEIEHANRVAAIKKKAADSEAVKQMERLKQALEIQDKAFEDVAIKEDTKLQAKINSVLKSTELTGAEKAELVVRLTVEADESQIQQEAIKVRDSIQLIEERLRELSESDTLTGASVEEFSQLSDQLDQLYNQKAKLEREYSAVVEQESERQRQARLDAQAQSIETIGEIVQTADEFLGAMSEREIARLDEQKEARSKTIEDIEERLQTATGKEKVELQKRLIQEKAALDATETERARVEKQEAKRAKGFAIAQSVINTALAVTKALASLPPPANFIAAGVALAQGIAQTAIIAAQPAAKGGVMGTGEVQPVEGITGVVRVRQNIPTQRNGDDVLATLKRGEVVLNRRQQKLLGGAPTFRAIRVPGFAEGGAAGAVISPPDVSGISNAERVKMLEILSAQAQEGIEATNRRIDRMRTYVVSEDIQNDLVEGENLKATATLG